ncbi:MAG TPA: hypothetical protein VGP93_02925, partial [Polyangiaceae bacterium]|nr:hypothetical protein [Polyangiaceae bacterium]
MTDRGRYRGKRVIPAPKDWVPPPLPTSPGLLAPVVAHVFESLKVGLSLWIEKDFWQVIHQTPDVTVFEYELGVAAGRWAHNDRSLREACRERRMIVREHAGFYDLFLPVEDVGGVSRAFVVGPFAKSRPTSIEIQRRWFELSGSQGRLSDRSFARYVSTTLGTLTLEGNLLEPFERLT